METPSPKRFDSHAGDAASAVDASGRGEMTIRLYIARSTPNSVRAEANLSAALERQSADRRRVEPEIIDVFSQPKRAINDGIIVTPTLVILGSGRRSAIVGDLSNTEQLSVFLAAGFAARPVTPE